jgi:toxin ParE1/3/4
MTKWANPPAAGKAGTASLFAIVHHWPGLPVRFTDEFERQVLELAARPERWMVATADIHRCLMKRFPYIIYFRRVDPERIRITVVKHRRRHPDYGRERK